jgi:hypothetical protein
VTKAILRESAAVRTIAEAIGWDEIVIIERCKGARDDAEGLLVGVGLLANVVQAAPSEAVLARPLVALRKSSLVI